MSDLLKDKGTIITEDPSLKEMLNIRLLKTPSLKRL